jgi:hypothetical protein
MESSRIFTECHADTLVVSRILDLRRVNHQANINAVLSAITLTKGKCIGVVDDDKRKPPEFKQFHLKEQESTISLYGLEATRLIVISPAIEGLLLECAEQANIDLGHYKIRNRKHLQQICKSINASQNQNLLAFINTLKQKNPPPIATMKSWIKEAFKTD